MTSTPLARTRQILDKARWATLATVSASGEPWSSVVHYVWLPDPLRLLFTSADDARHSKDIAGDPRVSGSLCCTGVDTGIALGDVDGAQFTGHCTEVAAEELIKYHDLFFGTLFPDPSVRAQWALPPESFRAPESHRLYLITVDDWWIIDFSRWAADKIDRRMRVAPEVLAQLGS